MLWLDIPLRKQVLVMLLVGLPQKEKSVTNDTIVPTLKEAMVNALSRMS
jgi:hypothetical protein